MAAVIGVTSCRKQLGLYSYHTVSDKYVAAAEYVGLPLILPSCNNPFDVAEVLAKLDGIIFTGSPSNVEPHHYQGEPSEQGTLHDPYRDQFTLPLIKLAIAKGVPILCICRGFQELNVALGGSLYQKLHELPGFLDHREPETNQVDLKYAPSHELIIAKGGLFEDIKLPAKFMVNSLHNQGVNRLADSLRVEGVAPDGLIEAVTVNNSPGFTLGVQWHPEWNLRKGDVISMKLFDAFKVACTKYANY